MNRELDFDYVIGDTVICINDKMTHPNAAFHFRQWPIRNHSYKVRGFADNDGIVTGVYLEELRNPTEYIKLLRGEQEYALATWRFKKAEEIFSHTEDELLNSLFKEDHEKIEVHI